MQPAELCAPLPDTPGAGPDLAFSAEFEALARWREHDDGSLAQGEWRSAPRQADWEAVQRESAALLRTRSKDLRLAGWWAEAAARRQGLPGLAEGMELVALLCEQWWDQLHPALDGGDPEARAAALRWWLARAGQLVRAVPVLQLERRGLGLDEIERVRRQALGETEAAAATWRSIQVAASGGAGLGDAATALHRTSAALKRLQSRCDAGLGAAAPSFDAAREALEQAEAMLAALRRDMPSPADSAAHAASSPVAIGAGRAAPPGPPGVVPTAAPPGGEPISRDEAIAQLRRIAEFLRRTEPHNPAAYLADKAARWAGLALHAWLREVLADPQALARVETTLGVARDAEPGS